MNWGRFLGNAGSGKLNISGMKLIWDSLLSNGQCVNVWAKQPFSMQGFHAFEGLTLLIQLVPS